MKTLGFKTKKESIVKLASLIGLFAAAVTLALVLETSTFFSDAPSTDGVAALALDWFAKMQTGQIDRTQLTPEFSKQLTNDSVRQMAQYLKNHDYGVPPQ